MLTDLSFLQRGKAFPPDDERQRLKRYNENRLLFEDEHAEVYKEQFNRIERVIGNFDKVVSYSTILNFQKLMSLKIADLVFGEPPDITVADDDKQTVVNKIIMDTDLFNAAYMAAIDVSRYGDGIMMLASDESEKAIVDVTSPALWFPVVDPTNIKRIQYHVFAWIYVIDADREQYGLRVQIHNPREPTCCEEHLYKLDGQKGSFKIGQELTDKNKMMLETCLNVCPVFRVSNTLTSDRLFGIDDYGSIDSIVSELIIRVSQISKVLDKFASPSMTGPASALTFNETLQEWQLKVGDYYPLEDSSSAKPEYLVWDANMDANFKQIELLTNQLYTISEMGSAVFGDLTNKTGDVPSGSALRRLMMSPLAKARRIANNFDTVLKKIISACSTIYGTQIAPEEISVKWNDGLPADPSEDAEIMNIRTGAKPTVSQYTAICRLDKMSQNDADIELAMIRADEVETTAGTGLRETVFEADEHGEG